MAQITDESYKKSSGYIDTMERRRSSRADRPNERGHEADPRGGLRQRKNVSDGIEETGRAKDEATEILELQSRSNRTVIETQNNIRENAEHQSKVADSASEMEGVANSSIGQVQSIQGAIKRHKELVSMMKMTYN